jgi:hypothetical protein
MGSKLKIQSVKDTSPRTETTKVDDKNDFFIIKKLFDLLLLTSVN